MGFIVNGACCDCRRLSVSWRGLGGCSQRAVSVSCTDGYLPETRHLRGGRRVGVVPLVVALGDAEGTAGDVVLDVNGLFEVPRCC